FSEKRLTLVNCRDGRELSKKLPHRYKARRAIAGRTTGASLEDAESRGTRPGFAVTRVPWIGLFLDEAGLEPLVDGTLHGAAPVVGAVDRAGKRDKAGAKVALALTEADIVLDLPQLFVDGL